MKITTSYRGAKAVIDISDDSRRVDVNLIYPDGKENSWHTNAKGEGRWDGGYYQHQTDGTCQYSLRGTPAAIRARVRKEIIPMVDGWYEKEEIRKFRQTPEGIALQKQLDEETEAERSAEEKEWESLVRRGVLIED